MDYTVKMYKLDKRCKEGRKLVYMNDYENVDLAQMERMYPHRTGYEVEFHETYVTRINMMSGKEYKERFDTPYYCSPSSESYWSM